MAHETRGSEYGVLHFLTEESGSLLDVIQSKITKNHEEIKGLAELGSVYLNDKRVVSVDSQILNPGQYVRVHTRPRRFDVREEEIHVIFENNDFIVANKPSGIPVHATVDNICDNLIACLQTRLGIKLYVTHRLDIATSGLIVLAKTPQFQAHFNSLLKSGKVEKEYRAIVKSSGATTHLCAGQTLIHFMEPSPRAPKTVSKTASDGWQKCSLMILETHTLDDETIELSIRLETGRTHQIRAQLGFEMWPIIGDVAYGSTVNPKKKNHISLVSKTLKFGEFVFTLE